MHRYAAQRAVVFAFAATFFEAFNVPVFWPILVLYFCVLFALSMKERIRHMVRHKYLPFTVGKPAFKGKEVSCGGCGYCLCMVDSRALRGLAKDSGKTYAN